MTIIKWRQSYETGVTSMDEQHRLLIGLINDLYEILRDNKNDSESLTNIIEECVNYGTSHLVDEEKILQKYNYQDLADHLQEHKSFTETITKLKENLIDDPEGTTPEIYSYLRKWWITHIVDKDKAYGQFLIEKGVNNT